MPTSCFDSDDIMLIRDTVSEPVSCPVGSWSVCAGEHSLGSKKLMREHLSIIGKP